MHSLKEYQQNVQDEQNGLHQGRWMGLMQESQQHVFKYFGEESQPC